MSHFRFLPENKLYLKTYGSEVSSLLVYEVFPSPAKFELPSLETLKEPLFVLYTSNMDIILFLEEGES